MEKILVVDDDSASRLVLKMYLENQGFVVLEAKSGTEALEMCQEALPDLVISDVMMPEMDGFEFCRRLRATRSGQLLPFIFLSSKGEIDAKVEGHLQGADDYLVKPFQPEEILAKVKAQLDKAHRIHSEMIRLLQTSTPAPAPSEVIPETPAPLPISPAEERVFWEVIQGYTNKEISEHLFISPRTVQAHLSRIFTKLNVDNRSQLIRFAIEQGYKPPTDNS